MFPTPEDTEDFRSRFGAESVVERWEIRHLGGHGIEAAALVTPSETREATLVFAWGLVREMARWILDRSSQLPPSERYVIIVGWSRSVRRLQGQIFKVGGYRDDIQAAADASDWKYREYVPLPRWEKDVFENRSQ